MPYKDKEKQKEYQRKYTQGHYQRHKKLYKARAKLHNKEYIERNKQYVNEIKCLRGCAICGYNHDPVALDFHHLKKKDDTIAALANSGVSITRLDKEIQILPLAPFNMRQYKTTRIDLADLFYDKYIITMKELRERLQNVLSNFKDDAIVQLDGETDEGGWLTIKEAKP